jgi:hypothetical protein
MHFDKPFGAKFGSRNIDTETGNPLAGREQSIDADPSLSQTSPSQASPSQTPSMIQDPVSSFWSNLQQMGESSPRIAEEFQKALDAAADPSSLPRQTSTFSEDHGNNRYYGRGVDDLRTDVPDVGTSTFENTGFQVQSQPESRAEVSPENSDLSEPDWDDHLIVASDPSDAWANLESDTGLLAQHNLGSSFVAHDHEMPLRSFEEERLPRPKSSLNISWKSYRVPVFMSLAAVVALVGVGYAAFDDKAPLEQVAGDIPLIKRVEIAERSRPETPGGLLVPDQDKIVLNGFSAMPKEDRLIPQPEYPTAVTASSVDWSLDGQNLSIEELTHRTSMSSDRPIIIDETVMQEAPEELGYFSGSSSYNPSLTGWNQTNVNNGTDGQVKLVQLDTSTQNDAAPAAVLDTPMAPALLPNQVVKPYGIQTGSFRAPESARSEWKRLGKKHPELLGDMVLRVQKTDLGTKGIWYRLQAGPLPNKATAADLCGLLMKRGEKYCITVKK